MHSRQFDTVLGRIGFDAKGDVTGFEPWQWFVWQADGTYVPLEQGVGQEIASGTRSRASDFPHCGRSSSERRIFSTGWRLNHGPPQIAFDRCHFDRGAVRAGGGGRDPDRRGRPDDGQECLVRRADGARRGAGRGRPQRRGRRARRAGAADHGGRLLRSRAGGRRRPEAGQRWRDLRRRPLLLRGLDPGIGNLRGGGSPDDLAGLEQPHVDRAGPCQRFPRPDPRRCGRCRGRQLPGRSLVRQEDRDPPRQHDLWQGRRRVDQGAVEPSRSDRSDLPDLRPWAEATMGPKSPSSRPPISPWRSLADTTPRSR